MGRIHNPAPNPAARANNYRWQDDPTTGEFSEYGRAGHFVPALAALCSLLITAALVYGALRLVLR